jgi:protein disulfide-isomerase A1
MRLSTRFSGVLALALAATAVASDVIDLTPSNFESTVNNEELMLVEFFAPW